MKKIYFLSGLMLALFMTACGPIYVGGKIETQGALQPDVNPFIQAYDGYLAPDSANDIVGSDADIYHELRAFPYEVHIEWLGDSVAVECENPQVLCRVSGADVVVDFKTYNLSGVSLYLKGKSDNGSLKIYGQRPCKMEMNGLHLTSKKGPAINNQNKKTTFVHLTSGTYNYLEDHSEYQTDHYYIPGNDEYSEDRKACFFSEGHLVLSGTGVLEIKGNYNHALASDATYIQRPGSNLVLSAAQKNALHIKGDTDDRMGIKILGGYIYANVAQDAAKCIKTDLHFQLMGGELSLNNTAKAVYQEEELDTSSPAGIKADGNVEIHGGKIVAKSLGMGARAINTNGSFAMMGGDVQLLTKGYDFIYDDSLHTYPHVLKSDGSIYLYGGKLQLYALGDSENAAALKTDANIFFSGAEVFAYANHEVMEAHVIEQTDGKLFAYSVNNDAIDAKESLRLTGGLALVNAAHPFESMVDAPEFLLQGATFVGLSGSLNALPTDTTDVVYALYRVSAYAGQMIHLKNEQDSSLMTYELPFGMDSMILILSHPEMKPSQKHRLYLGSVENILDASESWMGYYEKVLWEKGHLID